MTLYRIADWDKRYENNRSRLVKALSWVPVPNSHDGEAYARIMARKDAAEVFASWILLLQIASRCDPRGVLVRDSGQPLDAQAFSLKTRAPESWFVKSIPVLVDVGWIARNSIADNDTAPDCHDTDATLTLACVHGDEEGKGKKEGRVGAAVAGPTSDSEWLDLLNSNPTYDGINVRIEHGKMIAWCQANRKQPTRRRFINWLNRAERPMGQTPQNRQQAQPIREPLNWRTFLNHEYPDSRFSAGQPDEAHQWSDLDRSTQLWLVGEMRKKGQ